MATPFLSVRLLWRAVGIQPYIPLIPFFHGICNKVYLIKHDISHYYNVALYCNFLTMMTNSSKFSEKLVVKHDALT